MISLSRAASCASHFAEVEIFHDLGNELLRVCRSDTFSDLGEALALALPEPLALAGDRLHALVQPFAGEQRHDQGIGGRLAAKAASSMVMNRAS